MQIRLIQWKHALRSVEGQDFLRHMRDEGIPLLQRQPGFIRFDVASVGPRISAGIFMWESEEHALAGIHCYVDWLEEIGALDETESLQRFHGQILASSDQYT